MKEKFCLLENDEKTFNIIQQYIYDINNGIDLFKEDSKQQANEIKMHIYNCGKNGIDWSDSNADKMRTYLNACKELAFMYFCFDAKLNKENLEVFISRYNKYVDPILNKIY